MNPGLTAAVVIATKDRKDDLRTCLQSAVEQTGAPAIIVIDDGSTDGTATMVSDEFPTVRLVRHEVSRGYVVRRNEAARLTTSDIIFSIDDDARFSSARTVAQTLREFDRPEIGAVAIPYIEPNKGNVVCQRAPDGAGCWITGSYIGTAHAVRRDLFQQLGGYRESLFHQGEEGDYCLRMLEAGFVVRLGSADPIHHFESPRRDFRRMDYFGVRNAVMFVWQNVPMPYLLWHWPVAMMRLLSHTVRPKRLWTRTRGLAAGILGCATVARKPVSAETYRLSRRLASRPQALDIPRYQTSRV